MDKVITIKITFKFLMSLQQLLYYMKNLLKYKTILKKNNWIRVNNAEVLELINILDISAYLYKKFRGLKGILMYSHK